MNNNTKVLYTFGCSYTEDFESVIESVKKHVNSNLIPHQIKYINEHLNGDIPKSWPILLSKFLGYDLKNYGMGGASNYQIFENICKCSDVFDKGDIVIVGWTHFVRFRWPTNSGWSPRFTNYSESDGNISKKTHDEIVYNRDNQCVVDEIYNLQKILIKLSKSIGFDIYFWSSCLRIINGESKEFKNNPVYLLNQMLMDKYFFKVIFEHGGKTINDETNGKIPDDHLGKSGHEVQAKLFYEHILSTQKSN